MIVHHFRGSIFRNRIGRASCTCLTTFLLQTLFQLCFVCLLKHIAAVMGPEKLYFLELTTTNTRRRIVISVWEGNDLVKMTIAHCGSDVPLFKCSLVLCSQLWCAVLLETTVVNWGEEVRSLSRRWTEPQSKRRHTVFFYFSYPCKLRNSFANRRPQNSFEGRYVSNGSLANSEVVGSV